MCLDELTLSAYIDGELSHDEVIAVENHIELCSACKKRLDDFIQLQESLLSLDFEVSPQQCEESWNRFQANMEQRNSYTQRNQRSFWTRKVPMPIVSGIAALLVIMMGVTFSLAIQQQKSQGPLPIEAVAMAESIETNSSESVTPAPQSASQKAPEVRTTSQETQSTSVPEASAQTATFQGAPQEAVVSKQRVAAPRVAAEMSIQEESAINVAADATSVIISSSDADAPSFLAGLEKQNLFSPTLTEELLATATRMAQEDLDYMESCARDRRRGMGRGGRMGSMHDNELDESVVGSDLSLAEVITYLEGLDIRYKLWIPKEEEPFSLIFSDGEQPFYIDIPDEYLSF